jgi:hypothetical protein
MVPGDDAYGVPPIAYDEETELLGEKKLIGDRIIEVATGREALEKTYRCLATAKQKGLYDKWQQRSNSLLDNLRSEDDRRRFKRIHVAKAPRDIEDSLGELGIDIKMEGNYWCTEPTVVALYMQVLAEALRDKVKDSCLVSDASGYLGLETMMAEDISDNDRNLFDSLVVGLNVDTDALLSMPIQKFVKWHEETKNLRAGLRKKLADISADPEHLLPEARDEFRKFAREMSQPDTKWWAKSWQRMKSPQAITTLGVALPMIGLAITPATAGLGALITVPLGGALGTIGLVRGRHSSRWERYLLSMPQRPLPKRTGTKNIEDLINQL